jgi:TfoX/Sxy family transcriptional regulator of competence genes
MSAPRRGPEERYAEIVAALAGLPNVSQSMQKGFGASGLTIDGKLFAILRKDELLLKLPKPRVEALITAGDGRPFDRGQGRPMKEWLTVKPTATQDWLALAREAMQFVSGKR